MGNTPGSSAPAELLGGEEVCSNGDKEPCEVKLVPENVSKYYILDNRTPEEDETSPSFDAFPNLVGPSVRKILLCHDELMNAKHNY